MMSQTTLKDIATRLKLSISTVSRALKDHPDISDKTKKKVKALAEHLDYVPHLIASQLRSGNSSIIALVVPSLDSFFYYSVINSVEEWAVREGYSLVIYQTFGKVEMEDQIIAKCRNLPVVGIMMALSDSARNMDIFNSLVSKNIPLVFYDRVPLVKTFNRVYFDGDGAAELAMSKLLASRPKKVDLFLGKKTLSITEPRQRGCENALAAFDLPHSKVDYHYLGDKHQSETKAMELFESGDFDAFFCMSDELLVGVLKAAQRTGLAQYKDFDVISISNGIIPTYFFPQIQFIETNGEDIGKETIRRLFQLMKGDPYVLDVRVPFRFVKE